MVRQLYERGYNRQQVLDLFRFIDWVLNLPESLKREFWQELRTFEEDRRMPYITSVEEIGFERGIEQGIERGIERGIEQGEKSLIIRLLTRRLRPEVMPEALLTEVESLPLLQLETLGEALLDFQSLSDLEQWLATNSRE
jgi:predicted transposase YdaD